MSSPEDSVDPRTSKSPNSRSYSTQPSLRHLGSGNTVSSAISWKAEQPRSHRNYRVRFRHTLNPSVRPKRLSEDKRTFVFAANQRWIKAPKSISFVDETREIIGIHEVENQESEADHAVGAYSARTGVRNSASCQLLDEADNVPAAPAASYLSRSTSSELIATGAKEAGRLKHASNSEAPRRKRALRSASLTDTITVSSTGETTDQLTQSSVVLEASAATSTSNLHDLGSFDLHQMFDASTLLTSPSYESVFIDSPAPQTSSASFSADKSQSLSNAQIVPPRWPLNDGQEAFLFRYFIRELAPLFDLCDNLRHFAKVVPKRAPFCPPLLNAILAAAAKRLSRVGELDTVIGDRYYEECLRTLIPSLSSESAVKDENLLAATVILRFMEETDVPFSITGSQSHLIGTRVFLSAQEDSGEFSGLRLASFWVALRQDIFMAFIHSRPVHASLLTKDVAPVLDGASDECSYANKVILHCAYCLQYCFGGQKQNPSLWTELSNYLDRWHENKPWCFQSISPEEVGEARFLPNITYVSDEVLTGMQHYYLGRLALEAHSPETPRLGPGRNLALEIVNQRLKRIVRIICGISESNPETAPGYVNAAVSIVMAGDRFTDRREQQILYNILVKTEEQLAWPTGAAQIDLRNVWGWPKTLDMSIAGMLNTAP